MKAMIPLTYILGIESSCDDTAAAVLQYDGSKAEIMSSVVLGQNELHEAFGGVVPEIAARAHAEKLDHCIETAMKQSGLKLEQIDAIAVTAGPGLIGGVVSGVMVAKGLSVALGKPLIGVNHLVGHAVTPRLTDDVAFPYLMLLVSGGHCQFLIAHSDHRFERLGGTIDDAPGEAFDKTARILGLGQPGGPAIQHAAMAGDGSAYELPRPMIDRDDCNMSFSGLKTAIIRQRDAALDTDGTLSVRAQSNLAASFQRAVAEILRSKAERALRKYLVLSPSTPSFAVAGGVAANSEVREVLESLSEKMNVDFYAPPLSLCTDNAAMIAYAGLIRFVANDFDDLSLSARPRWPVDDKSPALLGSGKKGAKA